LHPKKKSEIFENQLSALKKEVVVVIVNNLLYLAYSMC
jgi:hypothetical protein